MRKTNIKVFDNSVYVDKWSYKKPSFKPNEDGEIAVAHGMESKHMEVHVSHEQG